MSAIQGALVPDVLSSSQSWELPDRKDCYELLDELMKGLGGTCWLRHADLDAEWSGPGTYRLQVRMNRPEGRPLYSLKWEGPL